MIGELTAEEKMQLEQTIEMFEVITQSQPDDVQSLEILKEAYSKLEREQDALRTAKRIAEAYLKLGQLSSAILEYESILQRFPDDPDVRKALADIETQATSITQRPAEADLVARTAPAVPAAVPEGQPQERVPMLDDGRGAMYKLFVDGKHISAGDFDLCWTTVDHETPEGKLIEPFLMVLQDKGILPLDKSLKVLCDKSRLAFIPLDKYDVDVETARKFPKNTCLRWSVLPFDRMSKTVLVATANPFNQQAARELSEATSERIIWYLASPPDLVKWLKRVFR
jgi:tetratricopeptide (TPR) repeat protein